MKKVLEKLFVQVINRSAVLWKILKDFEGHSKLSWGSWNEENEENDSQNFKWFPFKTS